MADLEYSYANARVKAMKSKLFDRDRMRELMDVRTLNEFIELLEESEYKSAFVSASTRYSGIELVKHALDDELVDTVNRIANFLPPKALPLFNAIARKWEVNNVKKVVAAKALSRPVEMSDLLAIDANSGGLTQKLIAAPDLPSAVEVLKASHYSKEIRRAEVEFNKTKDFRVFLSALDDNFYAELAVAAKNAPDAFTRGFVQDRIDFANATMVIRMLKSGVQKEKIRASAVGSVRLVAEMLSLDSPEAALDVFARKKLLAPGPLVEMLKTKGVSAVEVELERALLRKARSTLSRGVLSLGVAVAFLHLKREEVHSLRKIAYATEFEVKDEIRQVVLSAG